MCFWNFSTDDTQKNSSGHAQSQLVMHLKVTSVMSFFGDLVTHVLNHFRPVRTKFIFEHFDRGSCIYMFCRSIVQQDLCFSPKRVPLHSVEHLWQEAVIMLPLARILGQMASCSSTSLGWVPWWVAHCQPSCTLIWSKSWRIEALKNQSISEYLSTRGSPLKNWQTRGAVIMSL